MKHILFWFSLFTSVVVIGQNPNDCGFALVVCGNSNFGLEPAGVGQNEFSNPENIVPTCYDFSRNTIWLMFQFEEAGVFTFDLVPENGVDDYDFAVYGPNASCTSLGAPIRCSSTNPQAAGVSANTGLNMVETDTREGPGAGGNGYLKFIDVQAGDFFYVLVDRAIGSGAFSIEVTGSAVLPEQPTAHDLPLITTCDVDGGVDGFSGFNLNALIPQIIKDQQNVSVSFHKNPNDAAIGVDKLQSIYTNTSNPQTLYYRVQNDNSNCVDINQFEIEVKYPFEVTLPGDLQICNNSGSVLISADPAFSFYQWSTGEGGPDLNTIEVTGPGEYNVIVTNEDGCRAISYTTIGASEVATIKDIIVEEFNGNENSVTVIVDGIGEYEFSLDDQTNFQDSNIFRNLPNNYYTVLIRDKKGCGIVSEIFIVLDYPRFFTPNNDGFNDLWKIIGISEFPETRIYIYDRFGKLLKELHPNSAGWDGTFNDRKLPSDDYWFTIELFNGRKIKGNFSLKQ